MTKITIAEARDRGRTKAAWMLEGYRPLRVGDRHEPGDGQPNYGIIVDLEGARFANLYLLEEAERGDRQYTPHIADVFYQERNSDRSAKLWDAYEEELSKAFEAAVKAMEEAGELNGEEEDEEPAIKAEYEETAANFVHLLNSDEGEAYAAELLDDCKGDLEQANLLLKKFMKLLKAEELVA